MKSCLLLLALTLVSLSWSQRSNAQSIETDAYCEAVSVFIVGAAVATLTRGAHIAVQGGLTASGLHYGHPALQAECEETLDGFIDYYENNPDSWQEMLEERCPGNPYACAPLDPDMPNLPTDCQTFIVCAPFTINWQDRISIQELIDGIYAVQAAVDQGSWSYRDGPGSEIPY